jgi:hypothetical protein
MLKNSIIWFFGIIASLTLIFILYLIFIVKVGSVNYNKDESIEVTGTVENLYESGVKDLVFKLKNDSNNYYINRALENGFDLNAIKTDLLGKEITLWHSDSRSKSSYHMLQFKHKDSIYYTEWEIPLVGKN